MTEAVTPHLPFAGRAHRYGQGLLDLARIRSAQLLLTENVAIGEF